MLDTVYANFLSSLIILTNKFSNLTEPWAVTGSMNHALQGVMVVPKDIDIITTKAGAFQCSVLLENHIVTDVKFRRTKKLKSYFGVFNIANNRVEVMGDVKNLMPNGAWENHLKWDSNICFIQLDNISIPCLNLGYEFYIYTKLGFLERASLIRELL